MSQSKLALLGAVMFMLWGAIHIMGSVMVYVSGFAAYQNAAGPFPEIANYILGYFAYLIAVIGAMVVAVGWFSNRRNSPQGLALNTALVGFTDLGLVIFLVAPGHVSFAEASIGIILFAAALVPATMACRSNDEAHQKRIVG
jgi:hypothetical protein